jgi:hypothetical protein
MMRMQNNKIKKTIAVAQQDLQVQIQQVLYLMSEASTGCVGGSS